VTRAGAPACRMPEPACGHARPNELDWVPGGIQASGAVAGKSQRREGIARGSRFA
jgi:hypothetical protein